MNAKKMLILMKEKEHEESILDTRLQEERMRLIKQEINRKLIQEKQKIRSNLDKYEEKSKMPSKSLFPTLS